MDLYQIETFLAVARERGFSRAAIKLYRTQPAVSQTVRKLEEEIGEALFDRSSRDGTLTDAGRVLQAYAEKLLNLRGEALVALKELRQLHRGHLVIAANEFTCLYLLPVVDEFRRLHPMIKVTVRRANARSIPAELLKHGAELGVVTYRPEESGLRSVVVYRDELFFVVPRRHPLAAARRVSVRQLGAECFIAHNVPSPLRARVLNAFERRKVPLSMNVELPSIEAIKKFVARGNGVALLPGICVSEEVSRGELVHVPVPELRFERKIRLLHRTGSDLSHAGAAFLKVSEAFASHRKGYLYEPER